MKKKITKKVVNKVIPQKDEDRLIFNPNTIKKDPNADLLKWMRKNAIVTGKKVDVLKILKKVRG